MSALKVSEFMLNLIKQLIDEKKVTESTANAYVKSLYMLNGKAPFKTLTFLKNYENIDKTIAPYAENTQKALYTTITSILSLYKDKPSYKKVYAYYYQKMMDKAKDMKEAGADTSDKTEKEKENWIDWKEVQEKHKELSDEVDKFISAKAITPEQFNVLLHWVVLSLYTEVQPRRNQDYLDMYVVKKWNEATHLADKNYIDLATHQFIFNKYKTFKTYGQQKLPITRILNKIFHKKIGSSLLRHIFLSSKYDIKEMESDASAMGHSVEEQKKYLRGSGEEVTPSLPTLTVTE